MASPPETPPRADELEVSLFGPGYGEAIALHIGCGKWILVDSCTASDSPAPLHLRYLNAIGVDAATSVALVIVSHWHDDHIGGVASLVEACSSARVAISNALREGEFFTLASLYDKRPLPEGSGIDELAAVLKHLRRSGQGAAARRVPIFAMVDRELLHDELGFSGGTVQTSVVALSPSDAATLRSKAAFAMLIPAPGVEPARIAPITPNQTCVAILVIVGSNVLLFGSDLEATGEHDGGWSAVLASAAVVDRAASIYKLPHHGGASAHDDRVWTNLLLASPYAILTPFRRGRNALPSHVDVARIAGLTRNAFATGLPFARKWTSSERVVRDLVGEATRSIVEIVPATGHIRLRKSMLDPDPNWSVELFGGARQLQV